MGRGNRGICRDRRTSLAIFRFTSLLSSRVCGSDLARSWPDKVRGLTIRSSRARFAVSDQPSRIGRAGLTQALGLMICNSEYQVFKESLIAAARGPFFPDWKFPTLFGLQRSEVRAIADSFSPETELTGDVALALNNAVGNLLGYPHGQESDWYDWLSVTPGELQGIFSKWRASRTEA